jgi:ABC-2 type transport system ATP-binding protein
MDEAERCHRLAFILSGRLLTHGTVAEVIAASHLTTWAVAGPGLNELMPELRGQPGVEQAVAFGQELHVSSADPEALQRAIAPWRREPFHWREVPSSLEDVFIHLMQRRSLPAAVQR